MTRLRSPVLAARADEMDLLARAVANPPSVAVIEGEAGVGKTRLVEELDARPELHGRRFLVGHCLPLHEPFPLGPVIEAVRALGEDLGHLTLSPLGGSLRPVLPELAERLPAHPGPLGDRSMERHRLWRALVEALGAVGPAVLVIEDLHWADESTPQFLAFLLANQPPSLSLVLTCRAEGGPGGFPLGDLIARLPGPTSTVRVGLRPLDTKAVKVVIGAILGTDRVSDEFAAHLHERTAGLPLAVEEILRLLVDRKDIVRWRGHWARRALAEVEIPVAIRDSVVARLATLAPDARRLVHASAVLGEPAPGDLLATVAGLARENATAALAAALDAGIVQATDDTYGCRHALATQAVYDAIAAPERSGLHLRAAQALEAAASVPGSAPQLPAQLAHHWRRGGDSRRWVRWSLVAADLASELGDPATAAGLLTEALAAPGLLSKDRGRVALELSVAAMNSLAQADAVAPIQKVLEDEQLPPTIRGLLLAQLATLLHQAGDASAARAARLEAVPELSGRSDEPEMLAGLMTALAMPWVLEGDLDQHMGWLARAAEATELVDYEDARTVLNCDRAAVLLAVGDPAGWAAIPPAPAPGSPLALLQVRVRLCTNLAVSAHYLGHDRRAAAFVGEGLELTELTGYHRLSPALRTVQVLLAWAGGGWDGLEIAAHEVLDGRPDAPSSVQVTMVLGQLAMASGRQEEAEKLLRDATRRAGQCGALPTLAAAAAALARLHQAGGDLEAARARVLEATEAIAAKGIWCWAGAVMPSLVEVLVAAGTPGDAGRWSRRFAAGLRGTDAPAARAALGLCRGLLAEEAGRVEEGAALFARAEQAWRRLGRPYDAALAAEASARCLLGGRGEDAAGSDGKDTGAQRGGAALAAFADLGASWDEARVRRMLRRHDVVVPYPRRGRPRRYDAELSPREHEIVELAVDGLTSAQIGGRLFLSPRTVDHHLERALRKLGVATRKDLVAGRAEARRRSPD